MQPASYFFFFIYKFHFMLKYIQLCVDIIMTVCQHTDMWELVLQLVNMLVFIVFISYFHKFSWGQLVTTPHASCWGCHIVSVIVRNEIIEMFPSSSFPSTYFETFMTRVGCAVLFWLRNCLSKWAQHMLQCAYANQFVYQAGGWSARATLCVISRLLTFSRR